MKKVILLSPGTFAAAFVAVFGELRDHHYYPDWKGPLKGPLQTGLAKLISNLLPKIVDSVNALQQASFTLGSFLGPLSLGSPWESAAVNIVKTSCKP